MKSIQYLVLLGLCFLLVFSFQGCGKKAPPLPPEDKGNIIAAPYDLTSDNSNDRIILTWKHEIDVETAKIPPHGFEIFLAQKTFEDCEGCPFEFKKIATIPMPKMQFSIDIEKGFKYYFRIRATGEDGIVSENSKSILIENK